MGQLNIEHLLQATSPRSDRALVDPVRGGSGDPAFGNHLARMAAPIDTPRKPAPQPSTEPVAASMSSIAADEKPLREDSNNTTETRNEAEIASHPITNNTDNASQKGGHDQSSPANEDLENAETTNTLEVAEGDQSNAEENGSSDDAEESEIAADAALLVNAQAIAQASKTQAVISDEGVVPPEAAAPEIAAAKSSAANAETDPVTSKSDASVSKIELLQTEQAVDTTATRMTTHGEETAILEQNGVTSHQKRDSSRAEKKGEVGKTTGQVVTQPAEGADGNAVTAEGTVKLPEGVERNLERPPRSNRFSAKKNRPDVENAADDGASETARRIPRSETANNNASLAANPAAVVATLAAGAKATSSDNSVITTQKTGKPTNSPAAGLVNSLGRLQRGGHVTGSNRSPEGNDAPQVDVARFVGRVSKAFQTAQQRGGTLQLRLSPPELGALRLELMVKDGAMTAALQTETDAARRVLLDHLPALRDRLAEQNIRIERFDVDVRREDNGGQAEGRMLQHQQQRQQERESQHVPASRRAAARASISIEAAKAVPLPTAIGDGSGLNVVA